MPPQEKVPAADGDQEAFDEVVDGGFANAGYVEEEGGKKTKKEESNNNNNNNNEGEKVADVPFEFDDLLPYVGEFGLYQKMLFLMMIPFAFFVAFVYFSQIFITLTPEQHWCWIPELANLTREERIAIGIPKTEEGVDRCHMYAVNYTEVLLQGLNTSDPEWPTIPCRNGWEYNYTEVPYASIASEQNWVCENAALPTIAQSIFFGGAILGGLIFGWIADRQGRVVALLGTNLVGFAAGVATAFCNSFWAFCFCRFLVGMAYDNCFTMMYILVLEYVGPKWRTFVANMSIAIFFTFAACILPWIAWFVADWRMLCHVTSIPLALAILTPWFVPESARWLVSQGKIDKAIHILRKFERINGTKVEESIYQRFKDSCLKIQKQEENDRSYSVIDLFRTPRLRHTTLLLIVVWMAISLVFDGHVRNVGSLGLNVFLTFTIASFTEFPADTFLTFTLDVWGRRWLACGSMVISGIFSLLATAVPLGVASASLAIVGRFAVNISYNIGLQYAAELLPTVVRAQGVALIHIMGYVASIIAPFVVYLANVSVSLPLLILGVLGVIGGFLCLFLPETLDQELPQTLQDGERFGMGQKLLDFPCVKKPSPEKPQKGDFKRSFARSSMRASVRGEIRSSMIARSSVRKSVRAGDQA